MVSTEAQNLVGILLLALVTVETGGVYLLRLGRRGSEATDSQKAFARAGHAHAGVLLILAIALQPFADAADLSGAVGWLARAGVASAALLLPGGFFFSSMGQGRTSPNRWFVLIPLGGLVLAASLATLGIALLV